MCWTHMINYFWRSHGDNLKIKLMPKDYGVRGYDINIPALESVWPQSGLNSEHILQKLLALPNCAEQLLDFRKRIVFLSGGHNAP